MAPRFIRPLRPLMLLAAVSAVTLVACEGSVMYAPGRVELAFDSPDDGEVVSGNVGVDLFVDPLDQVEELTLTIDGLDVSGVPAQVDDRDGERTRTVLRVTVDTTSLRDGAVDFLARARFRDGRVAGARRTIVIDNGSPDLALLSPLEGEPHFTEDGPFPFTVRVGDSSGITQATLRVDGVEVARFDSVDADLVAMLDPAVLAPAGVTLPVIVHLEAVATDASGRSSRLSRSLRLGSRLRWRFDTLGAIETPPAALGDGAVVVGTTDDARVYVIEADGRERCRAGVGAAVVGGPTLSADGTFVVVGTVDSLRAIDVATCGTRWAIGDGQIWRAASALGGDGTFYAATYAGVLHAVDERGNVRWTAALGEPVQAAPVYARGVLAGADGVVVGTLGDHVIVFGMDGSEHFRFETAGSVGASPLATESAIYAGSYDLHVYGIGWDGARRWPFDVETGGRVQCAPTLAQDGTIVVCSQDGFLYGLAPDSGDVRWRYETAGFTYGGASTGESGTLYAGSVDGTLHALGADGGVRWTYRTHDAITARAIERAGVVFVGGTDRKLYAFDATMAPQMP